MRPLIYMLLLLLASFVFLTIIVTIAVSDVTVKFILIGFVLLFYIIMAAALIKSG